MKSIQTKTIINTPVNRVWETLMDFESYPKWNPFIQKITGKPEIGQQLSVSIHPPKKSPMKFTPVVKVATKYEEFRWLGNLLVKGIFDGEHYFKLRKINENQTELIHGENFTGVLPFFIFNSMKDSTTAGFELMNQSLKSYLAK